MILLHNFTISYAENLQKIQYKWYHNFKPLDKIQLNEKSTRKVAIKLTLKGRLVVHQRFWDFDKRIICLEISLDYLFYYGNNKILEIIFFSSNFIPFCFLKLWKINDICMYLRIVSYKNLVSICHDLLFNLFQCNKTAEQSC